jgi:NADPH2:quinone reductase
VRAAVLERTGGPDSVAVREVPEPTGGDGLTVVDVRAVGINFLEILVRQGRYPQAPPLPWVPGIEVAGTVGERRVVGLLRDTGGGYAERAAVDDAWLFDLPEGASFEEGAAFLMAFLTAWIPLTRLVTVRPGMRVMVTAAAGGTGTAAVQVARTLGADVVAVAGSEARLELPRSLGAAETATYEGLASVDPVDAVLDLVGGEVFAASIERLRPLGSVVAVGFAGGLWQPVDPALLVGRNVAVHGFYLGRLMRFRSDVVHAAASDLLRLWSLGHLRPVVGHVFPLDAVGDAHRLIEERRATGKVVLVP